MTTLRLYNTLTRTKEDFVPLDPANVRMYVCGPTVYDYAHIGNARPAIVFDVLFRLLRHIYGPEHVTYVRNITDIDDKINARALELKGGRNIPILDIVRELTVGTAKIYEADMAALGCLPPTHSPRATAHIPQMIAMIAALIEAGHAYAANGHVLFDVSSKADYGKLAKRSVDDMIAGARVDPAPYKKSPMDFVLWKPSDAQTPGWESPWGFGRPGWHLECSAMSAEYLGETFDIHGGGIDLVFPHHENEVAQSEGAHHNHPFARVWMHNGHLNVEGAKMSKSLGNFVTVHDLLKDWPGDVLRLNMLRTHYRQPIDWTLSGIIESRSMWDEFAITVRDVHAEEVPAGLIDALSDDLNTPKAISYLHELKDEARGGSLSAARELSASLLFLGLIKPEFAYDGLSGKVRITAPPEVVFSQLLEQANGDALFRDISDALQRHFSDSMDERVSAIASRVAPTVRVRELRVLSLTVVQVSESIDRRAAARAAKNFAESDRIRDELLAKGIVLKDSKDGTTWEVTR